MTFPGRPEEGSCQNSKAAEEPDSRNNRPIRPGIVSSSFGEHVLGRALLTPDVIMRLEPTRPLILIAGEPPYLLNRVSYLIDPAYAGRFDPNPTHAPHVAV
jgi:type IV secretory pathway TraG/TraD family ATPase VirD4